MLFMENGYQGSTICAKFWESVGILWQFLPVVRLWEIAQKMVIAEKGVHLAAESAFSPFAEQGNLQ